MKVHYPKLRNIVHTIFFECFYCFQRIKPLYFICQSTVLAGPLYGLMCAGCCTFSDFVLIMRSYYHISVRLNMALCIFAPELAFFSISST